MTSPQACIEERQKEGYFEWHFKADRLHKQGVRQRMCSACRRWRYLQERCELFSEAPSEKERAA